MSDGGFLLFKVLLKDAMPTTPPDLFVCFFIYVCILFHMLMHMSTTLDFSDELTFQVSFALDDLFKGEIDFSKYLKICHMKRIKLIFQITT